MGTRHNRSTAEGLENAVDNFLRAAGTFQVELFALATFRPTLQYILENFSHAPSRDLEPATLHMLVQLMCGQVVFLLPLSLLRPPPSRRASVFTRKQCWLEEKRSWCWHRRLPTLVKLTIRWSEERLHHSDLIRPRCWWPCSRLRTMSPSPGSPWSRCKNSHTSNVTGG